ARALLGLYPLAAGRVLVDGVPVEDVPAGERAARSGYLPQDPYLFSDTVRGNVLMRSGTTAGAMAGEPETPARLREALAITALDEDLNAMPAGLDTQIGEGGIRVSGGQRQRIGLARALAAAAPNRPGLLVLDDPFSAVDVDTEARVVAALRAAFGPHAPPAHRATIVLCSHRLAAFPQADLIVVLDGGQQPSTGAAGAQGVRGRGSWVVELGSHEALIRRDGLYARIYRAQRVVEDTAQPAIPAGLPS
ncbi:MAG TPA: ABC transporter ATP-binding protein, partial [Solirubrobacteraceae bacterium]